MGTTAIFSGNSRFAQDFQAVINRAVAIASLPLQQLQNQQANLTAQVSDLSTLDGKFSALETAVQHLQSAALSPSASVSDPSIVSATAGSGATQGTYTIEVVSLGSYTNTMSKAGLITVSDPSTQNISASGTYTLTINGTAYTVTPASNTLDSLVQAINGLSGANVQASLVNVGSSSAPDYRLTVQSTTLRPDTIQLNDGSADLLDTLATGANASYKVNGLTSAIQSDSRTVVLAPGVSVQLLQASTPGQATTVTVAANTSGIRDALSALVDAYNATVDALDGQRGKNGGSLTGLSIVNSLYGDLRSLPRYNGGTGAVGSLTDLGVVLDSQGKLSLDPAAFEAATAGGATAVLNFLGDGTSGFLKAATDSLNAVEDPTTGSIKTEISSTQQRIDSENQLIANEQDRIDQLQQSLQNQMAAADALIASLEQQVTYIDSLFQAMQYNNQNSK